MKNKKVRFNDIVEIKYFDKEEPIKNSSFNYYIIITSILILIVISLLL